MARVTNIQIPKLDLSSLTPEIKIEGDWVIATRVLDNIEPCIRKGYNQTATTFAKQIISIVRDSIINGTPPKGSGVYWAKHAPSTEKRYGKHPLLNLTGLYASLISVQTYSSRTYIGVPYNYKITRGDKTITMGAIARMLEFGTEKMPGRPLWAPTLKLVGGGKRFLELTKTNIKKQLMRDTGIKHNQIRW